MHDIVKKYPILFRASAEDFNVDAELWNFNDHKGWFALIEGLCESIYRMCEYNGLDNKDYPYFFDIKEKFGLLRIYAHQLTDEMDCLVYLIEHLSGSLCEHCGQTVGTERQHFGGWYSTLCPEHAKQRRRDIAWDEDDENYFHEV